MAAVTNPLIQAVYVSDKLFQMARDERDDAAGITVGLSRLLKVFNTDNKWGKVCIPAHPMITLLLLP